MSARNQLSPSLDQVQCYLIEYLSSFNHAPAGPSKRFRCLNPDHSDSNPSCSIVPGTDDKIFHCFSCGFSGNIFHAAHFLEDKPISGRGFILDNLTYLANKFGIELPTIEITDDEYYEMEVYRAYSSAASIIKNCGQMSDKVKSWLTDRGWMDRPGNPILRKIGVGSVVSYDDYIERMVKNYDHKPELLEAVDLARKGLFHQDNLLFTIKDEHGAPVGFAARNLNYEDQKVIYESSVKDILAKEGESSSKLGELFKPSKYYNTDAKNPIYQKSKRLFNFNLAKKFAPPLYVFEGYSDVVTAFMAGMKNCVSIGSTSFTKDHLDLILATDPPIKHLVFVLDADKAGNDGTARFVKLLEDSVGGHVGLRAEIVVMPEGSDDPDAFIRKYPHLEIGLREFRALEKFDVFTWKLRQGVAKGEDPLQLAEQAIPLIVNEANFLLRMDMTEKLAKVTKLDKEGLWREVMRMVDSDVARIEAEKIAICNRTATELKRNPKDAQSILQHAIHQTEQVEKTRMGYDPRGVVKSIEFVLERAAKSVNPMELSTGYELLDKALNGIPREECFISLPGKPNQGKSTFLDNLTIGLLDPEHNKEEVIVFFHTIDDALSARIPRMLGAKFSVPSEYFKRAGYYRKNPHALAHRYRNFEEIYHHAENWMSGLVSNERLVVADVSQLPPQLPALEQWVRAIRNKFPNRPLVVMGDNFHLYDLPGYEAGESKTRAMSMFVKRLTTEYRCTILMTAELPKSSLTAGTRPRIGNIKGSSGIAYDANVNFGIYNDLKDRGEKANMIWHDALSTTSKVDTSGIDVHEPAKRPIIEVVIDKSKISDFDGSIFFRLDPISGNMRECGESEQSSMKELAYGEQ